MGGLGPLFAESAENGSALLQDGLLQGRPADEVGFCLADDLAVTTIEDGLFLADPSTQVSCRLNATAALILSYCTPDHTISDITHQLALLLSPEWSGNDVHIFVLNTLWQLRSLGFIRLVSAAAPSPSPTRLDTPLRDVHLFLTKRCPLHCVHCCISHDHCLEMTTLQSIDLLNQLQYLGLPKLSFTGGEPLLRDDFFEIAEEARALGLTFELATSGVTLDCERASRISRLNPFHVNISLYSSDPEVHDQITGVSGSWTRSLTAIHLLTNFGVPVTLKCMVMSLNYASYAGVADLADELGQSYAFDPGITCRLDGCQDPLKYRIPTQHLREFARTRFWRQADLRELDLTDRPCNAAAGRCAIGANGDVYPCVLFPMVIGSILERPLREILNGPRARQIRQVKIKEMGHCAACINRKCCTPCPGLAFLEHGDYRSSPQWCCTTAMVQRETLANKSMEEESADGTQITDDGTSNTPESIGAGENPPATAGGDRGPEREKGSADY